MRLIAFASIYHHLVINKRRNLLSSQMAIIAAAVPNF